MERLKYTPFERVYLKDHPELDEKWVQNRIAEEPSLLGLGDVVLKDKERPQPHAGRLDLLLQEVDGNGRYEVEIQLGKTDESHIIRTIEYWDIERKRYPQYDHTAVIVAEDITSRFLNVISLFNGSIPLMAIQMRALRNGDQIGLVFSTVLSQLELGLVEEDEEVQEVTDRIYWEKRGTPATVKMVDRLLELVRAIDPNYELKYNKFYIGLAKNGQPDNLIVFKPQKNAIRIEPRLKRSPEMEQKLEAAGLDLMEYDERTGRYLIRLKPDELDKHSVFLKQLFLDSRRSPGPE